MVVDLDAPERAVDLDMYAIDLDRRLATPEHPVGELPSRVP